MADETPQVSAQPGEEGLPTPTFSEPAASSPSVDADTLVSTLLERLEPLIERKVQSQKDKRIAQIEKALSGRGQVLAELEGEGVAIPKEVRAEMRIRELEERLAQVSQQPGSAARDDGSSQSRTATVDAIATLKQYGLDANDSGFIEVLRGRYPNRDAFDKAVLSHVVSRLAPQKPASPADVVQAPATGISSSKMSPEQIEAKAIQLRELYKQPTRNKSAIAALEKELEPYWK